MSSGKSSPALLKPGRNTTPDAIRRPRARESNQLISTYMKTELDLLTEALRRLEEQHQERCQQVETRLSALAEQLEQWALRTHTLSTQVNGLTLQLKQFENALLKR